MRVFHGNIVTCDREIHTLIHACLIPEPVLEKNVRLGIGITLSGSQKTIGQPGNRIGCEPDFLVRALHPRSLAHQGFRVRGDGLADSLLSEKNRNESTEPSPLTPSPKGYVR